MFKKIGACRAQIQKRIKELGKFLYVSVMLLVVLNMSYLGVFFVANQIGVNPGNVINEASAHYSPVWPNCNWNISANEVSLKSLWLGNSSGAALASTCQPGSNVTAYVWGKFNNATNNDMSSVILLADLYTNNSKTASIDNCLANKIEHKAETSVNLYQLNWTCGDEIKLDDIIVTWDQNNSCKYDYTPRKCTPPSKAATYSSIKVAAPLIASFTSDAPKCGTAAVNFDGKATGGESGYSYSWNFGDGSPASTLENPSHSYINPGTYSVVLKVTSGTKTDTETKSIVINAMGTNTCPTYAWSTGDYGVCGGATCGTGTQTRTVSCLKNNTTIVADSYCVGTKPATSKSCSLGACPICGDNVVNQLSEQCDGGFNTCTTVDGYNGNKYCGASCTWDNCVPSESCGDKIVNGHEACELGNTQDCITSDGYNGKQSCLDNCSGYGSCVPQESCGNGVKDGTEQCDRIDGVTAHYQCTASCTLEYVPYCGDGVVNQVSEQCDGPLSSGYPSSYACDSTCKLTKTFSCGIAPTDADWNFISPYDGTYHQTCLTFVDGLCTSWDPVDSEPLSSESGSMGCPFICHEGYTYIDGSCINTTTYHWKTELFGDCSVTCGGGTQTRTVTCVNNTDTPMDDETLCTDTKPDVSQDCNMQSCGGDNTPTYSWVTSDFGSCSATCGGGTQSTSVSCVSSTDGTVADELCSADTKPEVTSQACNTQSCGGGGGGGGYVPFGIINPQVAMQCSGDKVNMTVTWLTSYAADSRVVYDTVSHAGSSVGSAPNYAYASSTTLDSNLMTGHSVTINGLNPSTIYYFRPISNYNYAETLGEEKPLTQTLSCAPGTNPNEVIVLGEEGAPVLALSNKFLAPFANPGAKGVDYEITVTNNGDLTSYNTVLENVLPAGLTYSDDGTNTKTWNIGDIEAGKSKVVKVKVDVAKGASIKDYSSVASVSSSNFDKITSTAALEIKPIIVLAETGFSWPDFIILGSALLFMAGLQIFLKKKIAGLEK